MKNFFIKKIIIGIYTVLFAFLCNTELAAQGLGISGTVKDISGEYLPGVTILIKGSEQGTITDIDGNYKLENITKETVLVFSYIGMKTQEILVGEQAVINVVLEFELTSMDEVVVIGYGASTRRDLTGSLSTVRGEDISAMNTTQIATALQGAMAGITATRTHSAPGAGATIRIRGITSIQDSSPLVIVDGIPVNSINDVNPADVDNITVLKDAASASIYGARAAAGVILITTKRAEKNIQKVEYNYSFLMDYPSRMPDYADAITYMKFVNERNWNDNPAGGEYTVFSQELIEHYWQLNTQDPDLYPNTDWVSLCLKDWAPRQNHQLGFTIGSNDHQTRISIGYDDVDGLFKENLSWNRVTARLNNDITFSKWITTSTDIYLRRTESVNPAFSPSSGMRYAAPVYPGVFSDGRLAGGKDGANPYGRMMYGGENLNSQYSASGRIAINLTPINNLIFTGIFAPDFTQTKTKGFNKQVPYYVNPSDVVYTGILDQTETTDLKEGRYDNYSYTTQVYANYKNNIGNHNYNAMVGFESFYYFRENMSASRSEYDLTYYPYLSSGPGHLIDNAGDAHENAYNSYFGRILYNWKYKYYLQANLRYDGSSRFHKDYRWSPFPSFSAGWMVSNEEFMNNISVVSMLRLRASWGQLGNERIGNYPYQSTLAFSVPTLYIGNTVSAVQGASTNKYSIRDITWETTETTNLGFDIILFGNRFEVSGDYYWKETKDMLLKLQIPLYMGYTDPDQNAGIMSTKGWDIEMAWKDRIRELNYTVSFNISDYKTIMGNMEDTQVLSGGRIIKEGSEYMEWYGYLSDGIFQSVDEITPSTPRTSLVVTAGDIRYVDVSGPNGEPDGIINTYDRVLLGGSLPRLNFGGNIYLLYKGFDFLLSYQGVGKRLSRLSNEMVEPVRADWLNVPEIIIDSYWSQYNTPEQNLNAKYPRTSRISSANNYAVSNFWLIDGSYFRIKNITLGYSFSNMSIIDNVNIKDLRLYLSLQDYFTLSHFPRGWDPEVGATAYPITKSIVFGLRLGI